MRRAPKVLAAVLLVPSVFLGLGRALAASSVSAVPTPDLSCGAGDHPETTQGRTPLTDFKDGRSNQGYTCNASLVSHLGSSGGFRVYRYVDTAGHVCAFFDSATMFPTAALSSTHRTGVYVLDMKDPAHPVMTADLMTPAMQSPHESLSLNVPRGLLGADMGNAATYPGWVDIYDVGHDCRNPTLDSSLPIGGLGHEGTFSPDGRTFWVTSVIGNLTALDISNPTSPRILYQNFNVSPHGLNVSNDGKTLYYADLAGEGSSGQTNGLTILDVSQVQARQAKPTAPQIAHLTWDVVSVPQVPIPITIHGHHYVVEMDEFDRAAGQPSNIPVYDPTSPVGAARIIDIADPTHPQVISSLRLQVNQPANRAGDQRNDPGATANIGGYTGHYCAIPQRQDPGIVACSFVLSGLRVFDIRDPYHPKEIAYFNMPPKTTGSSSSYTGSNDVSQAAFDVQRGQIWYVDGSSGFYVVQIRPGIWPFGH